MKHCAHKAFELGVTFGREQVEAPDRLQSFDRGSPRPGPAAATPTTSAAKDALSDPLSDSLRFDQHPVARPKTLEAAPRMDRQPTPSPEAAGAAAVADVLGSGNMSLDVDAMWTSLDSPVAQRRGSTRKPTKVSTGGGLPSSRGASLTGRGSGRASPALAKPGKAAAAPPLSRGASARALGKSPASRGGPARTASAGGDRRPVSARAAGAAVHTAAAYAEVGNALPASGGAVRSLNGVAAPVVLPRGPVSTGGKGRGGTVFAGPASGLSGLGGLAGVNPLQSPLSGGAAARPEARAAAPEPPKFSTPTGAAYRFSQGTRQAAATSISGSRSPSRDGSNRDGGGGGGVSISQAALQQPATDIASVQAALADSDAMPDSTNGVRADAPQGELAAPERPSVSRAVPEPTSDSQHGLTPPSIAPETRREAVTQPAAAVPVAAPAPVEVPASAAASSADSSPVRSVLGSTGGSVLRAHARTASMVAEQGSVVAAATPPPDGGAAGAEQQTPWTPDLIAASPEPEEASAERRGPPAVVEEVSVSAGIGAGAPAAASAAPADTRLPAHLQGDAAAAERARRASSEGPVRPGAPTPATAAAATAHPPPAPTVPDPAAASAPSNSATTSATSSHRSSASASGPTHVVAPRPPPEGLPSAAGRSGPLCSATSAPESPKTPHDSLAPRELVVESGQSGSTAAPPAPPLPPPPPVATSPPPPRPDDVPRPSVAYGTRLAVPHAGMPPAAALMPNSGYTTPPRSGRSRTNLPHQSPNSDNFDLDGIGSTFLKYPSAVPSFMRPTTATEMRTKAPEEAAEPASRLKAPRAVASGAHFLRPTQSIAAKVLAHVRPHPCACATLLSYMPLRHDGAPLQLRGYVCDGTA